MEKIGYNLMWIENFFCKLKKAKWAETINVFLFQNQLFFAAINLDFSFRNIFQKLKLLIRKCCITFWGRHYRLSSFHFKFNRIFFIIIKCGGGPHKWLHELKKEISFPWKKRANFWVCFPKLRKTNASAHAKSENSKS